MRSFNCTQVRARSRAPERRWCRCRRVSKCPPKRLAERVARCAAGDRFRAFAVRRGLLQQDLHLAELACVRADHPQACRASAVRRRVRTRIVTRRGMHTAMCWSSGAARRASGPPRLQRPRMPERVLLVEQDERFGGDVPSCKGLPNVQLLPAYDGRCVLRSRSRCARRVRSRTTASACPRASGCGWCERRTGRACHRRASSSR